MDVKPRASARIPGTGGRFFDWRGTGLCPPVLTPEPSGRLTPVKQRPLWMVEHIPVIRNVTGPGDFISLANVLRAQRLSLQGATDAEGNVALYANLDELCYQARGANSVSCGVEHMHATITEPWTREQLLASAWFWQRAEATQGIPLARGKGANGGAGIARVLRPGHVTHAEQSAWAGFHDRSDPGPGYDFEFVARAARFFKRRRTFKGA